ncbi:MAG: hypothetical protein Q9222_001419 [Ikaeria aurantiellina]
MPLKRKATSREDCMNGLHPPNTLAAKADCHEESVMQKEVHKKASQPRQTRSSTVHQSSSIQPSPEPTVPPRKPESLQSPSKTKRNRPPEDDTNRKRQRLDPQIASPDPSHTQEQRDGGTTRSPSGCERSSQAQRTSQRRAPLSRENLRELDRQTSSGMDPPPTILSGRVRKRAMSRQTSLSDINQDVPPSTPSRKSLVSNASYRWNILQNATIQIHCGPPPELLHSQLDTIFKQSVPEDRKSEISSIVKQLSEDFIIQTQGSHREDDWVEIVYEALKKMYDKTIFASVRKAGTAPFPLTMCLSLPADLNLDWDLGLKPVREQDDWNYKALDQPKRAGNDIAGQGASRQQGDPSFPTPEVSSPLPSVPSMLGGTVKTPRPDFTVGLSDISIVRALVKREISEPRAKKLLRNLQENQKLRSDPTQHFLPVRFPILVIEGKAYATGTTIFEAENQAAVSGSCMVNIYQQLMDLHDTGAPEAKSTESPLAFSICTQGPFLELWVHYSALTDVGREHHMHLLAACHGCLSGGLEDFYLRLEQLLSWYKKTLLEKIADRLFGIATRIIPPGPVKSDEV